MTQKEGKVVSFFGEK